MTLLEFQDRVTDMCDLIRFCEDNDVWQDRTASYVSEDEFDSDVEDDIPYFLRNDYWYNLAGYLNDIPSGSEWYIKDGMFDYTATSFDEEYSELEDYLIDIEFFDEDVEEVDEELIEEAEPISFEEFIGIV